MSTDRNSTSGWLATGVLLLALVAPWFAIIGSHLLLETCLPGLVLADYWRDFCSVVFVVAGFAGVRFFTSHPYPGDIKVPAIAVISLYCLWGAGVFQLRSMCGDEPPYIGEVSKADADSCQ